MTDYKRTPGQAPSSPGGSSAGPLSWAAAEAAPGVTVAAGSTLTVSGWSIDTSGGSDITLDVDTETLHLTPGVYDIQAGVVAADGDATSLRLSVNAIPTPLLGQEFGPVSWSEGINPVAGTKTEFVTQRIGFTVVTDVTFTVSPLGGSTDESVNYVGLDIVRIGDLAPLNT